MVTRRRRQNTAFRFMVKCQLFQRATELGLESSAPFLFVRIGGASAARFPSRRNIRGPGNKQHWRNCLMGSHDMASQVGTGGIVHRRIPIAAL